MNRTFEHAHNQSSQQPGGVTERNEPLDGGYASAYADDYTRNTASVGGPTGGPGSVPGNNYQAEKKQPPVWWVMLRELLETIVLSLIIFFLVRQVVQNYRIESHSMQPNFYEGQFILVNKLAYRLGEPTRGQVVVFNNPSNTDEDYIKRIIALPGDTIEIKEQTIFINGEVLNEPYDKNMFHPQDIIPPTFIEPNHLFVMGDNRPNSSDSRRFGPLSQDLLVGKAWLRVWPVSAWGLIEHYELEPGEEVGIDIYEFDMDDALSYESP
ncbi:MAG: signal peptidase I [Chloroflexota bacterium]